MDNWWSNNQFLRFAFSLIANFTKDDNFSHNLMQVGARNGTLKSQCFFPYLVGGFSILIMKISSHKTQLVENHTMCIAALEIYIDIS